MRPVDGPGIERALAPRRPKKGSIGNAIHKRTVVDSTLDASRHLLWEVASARTADAARRPQHEVIKDAGVTMRGLCPGRNRSRIPPNRGEGQEAENEGDEDASCVSLH